MNSEDQHGERLRRMSKLDLYSLFNIKKKKDLGNGELVNRAVARRGDIIRRGKAVNYKLRSIQKFRKIVEKHFFKKNDLDHYENLAESKFEC